MKTPINVLEEEVKLFKYRISEAEKNLLYWKDMLAKTMAEIDKTKNGDYRIVAECFYKNVIPEYKLEEFIIFGNSYVSDSSKVELLSIFNNNKVINTKIVNEMLKSVGLEPLDWDRKEKSIVIQNLNKLKKELYEKKQ